MYNGIGLQTARGSGTNGYVQRNMSFVPKTKAKVNYRSEEELRKLDAIANKKPNEGILAHERKRVVELKCLELQELMEVEGYAEEDINSKVSMLRKMLLEKDVDELQVPKDDFGRPLVKETHQMAEANQEKNVKMREALGISQYFVEGSSMDPERKSREAAAAAAAEAKKSYSLIPVSSSSSELDSDKEKRKPKRKRSNASKRSEESSSSKKKKSSKKNKRERSESVEVKKKHRQKKASKDKGKHKKNKVKHKSDSTDSESDANSGKCESISSRDSSVSSSSSVESHSVCKDLLSPSISKARKKKDHGKQAKKHHSRKHSKVHSSEESATHSKNRRSRRDKYEFAKKKSHASKGFSRTRSVTSSSSSDAESTEQYYRLEPVFVKSKSKHKKDIHLIEVQSKRKGRHDKHLEKRKKRLCQSSSSSSDTSLEKELSRSAKKKRCFSGSPTLLIKRSLGRTKNVSKKYHKRSPSSSVEHSAGGNLSKSRSKSLSYSPISNSRSIYQNTPKKSSNLNYGHSSQRNEAESASREKEHSKPVKVTSKKHRDKHSKGILSESDEEIHVKVHDHANHKAGKHNGYQKPHSHSTNSYVSHSNTKVKKKHDSSASESDKEEDVVYKKGSKPKKRAKKQSSPYGDKKKAVVKSSSVSQKEKHRSRHSSTESDDSDRNALDIHVKKKKHSDSKKRKRNSSSSSHKRYSSRSRSRSISGKHKKQNDKLKSHKEQKRKNEKYHVVAFSSSCSRSASATSQNQHANNSVNCHLNSEYVKENLSPFTVVKQANEKDYEFISEDNKACQSPVNGNNAHSSEYKKKQSSIMSPYHKALVETLDCDDMSPDAHQSSTKNYSSRNSLLKMPLKNEESIKHSKSPSKSKTNHGFDGCTSFENHTWKHDNSNTCEHSKSSPNHRSDILCRNMSNSPVRCKSPIEKHLVELLVKPKSSEDDSKKFCDSQSPKKNSYFSSPKVEKLEANLQSTSIMKEKSPREESESQSAQCCQNLSSEKPNAEIQNCRKGSRSASNSPHQSRRSRTRSSTRSPYNDKKKNEGTKNSRSASRESSCSSGGRQKTKNKSKSPSESKSRSRSRSITRSKSRTYSLSRSRSRTKSSHSRSRSRSYTSRSQSRSAARSPSIPRRKGSPSFLDKRRITRARSVSGHRRHDSRSYSRSPSNSYYDRSSSSSNFSRVYRR